MRILITGINGQVGSAFVKQSRVYKHEIIPFARKNWDMAKDPEYGDKVVLKTKPDLVINAAGYTDVEKAENEEVNAFRVNAIAPKFLAKACKKLDIPLYHLSTDYVFDGKKKEPYLETDQTNPINIYGHSKLAGEVAIKEERCKSLIIRSSWIFSKDGNNFINKILEQAHENNNLKVVNDEFGGPTCANDIAKLIFMLCNKNTLRWGVYHYSGQPFVSRYEFAKEIIACQSNINKINIQSCTSDDYQTISKRPKYSKLSCDKLKKYYGIENPNWILALHEIMKKS